MFNNSFSPVNNLKLKSLNPELQCNGQRQSLSKPNLACEFSTNPFKAKVDLHLMVMVISVRSIR